MLHTKVYYGLQHLIFANPSIGKIDNYFDIGSKRKVGEKSRECHNHKPQPFPDSKRKRKPTNPNKHKPNKHTKSTKISSLFPKQGNRNTKRTEKHKNKMTHGKTYNKSPRRINHKATWSKTNIRTTARERMVEQTTGGPVWTCLYIKQLYSRYADIAFYENLQVSMEAQLILNKF